MQISGITSRGFHCIAKSHMPVTGLGHISEVFIHMLKRVSVEHGLDLHTLSHKHIHIIGIIQ